MKRILLAIMLLPALLAGCGILRPPVKAGENAALRIEARSLLARLAAEAGREPSVEIGDGTWRYACEAFDVDIELTRRGECDVYIARTEVRDMAALRAAYAYDEYGGKRREYPDGMAKRHGAVFAVNGDYYSYRTKGVIVRNGNMDRNRPEREMLAIFADGSMRLADERTADMPSLLGEGLLHTFSFGPALVREGKAETDFSRSTIKPANPRTGAGMIGPGEFVFVVADGRREDSQGMRLTDFAALFEELGCSVAYNLDGGASSTMLFMGEVINSPSGNASIAGGEQRTISDILYLAEP